MDDGFVSTDAKWGENFFEVRVPGSNEIVRIYHSYWRGEEKSQREWQGLTDEELSPIYAEYKSPRNIYLAIESALREKNT